MEEINSREIAGFLFSFADVLQGKAQELQGFGILEDESNGLFKESERVRELANILYEAKVTINA